MSRENLLTEDQVKVVDEKMNEAMKIYTSRKLIEDTILVLAKHVENSKI